MKKIEIAPGMWTNVYTHEEVVEKANKPIAPWVVDFVTKNSAFSDQEKKEYLDPENYRKMMLGSYERMCEEHGKKVKSMNLHG